MFLTGRDYLSTVYFEELTILVFKPNNISISD